MKIFQKTCLFFNNMQLLESFLETNKKGPLMKMGILFLSLLISTSPYAFSEFDINKCPAPSVELSTEMGRLYELTKPFLTPERTVEIKRQVKLYIMSKVDTCDSFYSETLSFTLNTYKSLSSNKGIFRLGPKRSETKCVSGGELLSSATKIHNLVMSVGQNEPSIELLKELKQSCKNLETLSYNKKCNDISSSTNYAIAKVIAEYCVGE